MKRKRDVLGRYLSNEDYDYYLNLSEDESWEDLKCYDVRFPIHKDSMVEDVKTTILVKQIN